MQSSREGITMPRRLATTLLPLVLLAAPSLHAQTKQSPMPDMPGMDMQSMETPANHNAAATHRKTEMNTMKPPNTLIDTEPNHTNSGTTIEPASPPTPIIMPHPPACILLLHA